MKPLTVEELKALSYGDWVWIEILREEKHYDLLDTGYYRKNKLFETEELFDTGWHGFGNSFKYKDYQISWVAYKNKEQAEEYKESLNNVKEMLADCCCECTRYEIDFDKLKGKS